jgi:hypothetical protein
LDKIVKVDVIAKVHIAQLLEIGYFVVDIVKFLELFVDIVEAKAHA